MGYHGRFVAPAYSAGAVVGAADSPRPDSSTTELELIMATATQFQPQQQVPGVPGPRRSAYLKKGVGDELYVDYKAADDLRRLMTPNGKIYSRKRLGVSAREQRMISQAIKRARYMALLPYTDATL